MILLKRQYTNATLETAREDFASSLESKDKMIASLQEKTEQLAEGKQILAKVTAEARSERDQAVKESTAAKEQAETSAKLVAEKDKTISTLADKLGVAEAKAAGYDDLKKSEEVAKLRISELEKEMERMKEAAGREMAAVKKDHETEIRELNAEMERKISDAQKDAALELAKAVNEKEHEMMGQIREMDKLNARLQFENEELKKK